MVGRKRTRFTGRFGRTFEIRADFSKASAQTAETGQLVAHTGGKSGGCAVLDVAQQMFDADFLSFFGLDRRRDVEERLLCFGSVLNIVALEHGPVCLESTLTSLIFSTAKYASVGILSSRCRTLTMTITGRGMNCLKRSLISWSDARSFGPE